MVMVAESFLFCRKEGCTMINGWHGIGIECFESSNCRLITVQLIIRHSLRHHFFCRETIA